MTAPWSTIQLIHSGKDTMLLFSSNPSESAYLPDGFYSFDIGHEQLFQLSIQQLCISYRILSKTAQPTIAKASHTTANSAVIPAQTALFTHATVGVADAFSMRTVDRMRRRK
jgi:hypothetical protein